MLAFFDGRKDSLLLAVIILLMLLIVPLGRFIDISEGFSSTKMDYIEVEGIILNSSSKYVGGGGKSTSGYKLDINYQYSIDGIDYTSNKYSFGQSKFFNVKDASKITQRYKSGDLITVFVKKRNHEVAVLNFDDNSNFDFLVLFIMIVGISSYATWDFVNRRQRKTNKHKK